MVVVAVEHLEMLDIQVVLDQILVLLEILLHPLLRLIMQDQVVAVVKKIIVMITMVQLVI